MKITLDTLPQNATDMQAAFGQHATDEYYVSALVVAALCRYPESVDDACAMLDVLKGPEPLSPFEKQFLRDRFAAADYVARSYWEGATPDNNYQPAMPYAIDVEKAVSQEEGWASMLLTSGGADSPRFVKLRQKRSTGQWFLNDQMLLAGIRTPVADDPWA